MIGDNEQVARAAARSNEVVPSHLIGVSYARIPDRRNHIPFVLRHGKEISDRKNGAPVAVGRGIDVIAVMTDDDRRADEISGGVKALGPVDIRSIVLPHDDKAAVGKGRYVVNILRISLIEEIDENIALDEAAIGIIDRRADAQAGSVL